MSMPTTTPIDDTQRSIGYIDDRLRAASTALSQAKQVLEQGDHDLVVELAEAAQSSLEAALAEYVRIAETPRNFPP